MARVVAGGRLHAGFQNLSLAHPRLYGGIGVALAEPRLVVEAEPAEGIDAEDGLAREYAARAVDLLEVPGVRVSVPERLPRHVGLGSGTQLALATYAAVALAHGREPEVRAVAPALGRGGRSGVGVAAFEAGGFVVDAGHPTTRFTADRPADGEWTVPAVLARHAVPADWRFVLVVPAVDSGRSGDREDESMRTVVERADPGVADAIARVVLRELLPAVATGEIERFGTALARVGRLNGTWYADEQGGVYRPPVGRIVETLSRSPVVYGAGQSSWGPTVYGVTHASEASAAREAAEEALRDADVEGSVRIVAAANRGAVLGSDPEGPDD